MNKVIVENKKQNNLVEKKDRRFGKAMVIALTNTIYKVENTKSKEDEYRVQSESDPERFYVVKFIDACPLYCSCKDWQTKSFENSKHLCKHMKAIPIADLHGLIKPITIVKTENVTKPKPKTWKDDQYDF